MPAVENCWLQVWLSSYRIDYVTATFKLQSSEMLIDVVLHEFIAIQAHLLPKALSAAATCSHERILKWICGWRDGSRPSPWPRSQHTKCTDYKYGSNLCEYPCQHKGSNRGTPVQTLSNVQLGPESTGLAWAYQAVKGPWTQVHWLASPAAPRLGARWRQADWLSQVSNIKSSGFPPLKKTTLNPFILKYQSSKKHPCEILQVWRLCNCIRIEGACICI